MPATSFTSFRPKNVLLYPTFQTPRRFIPHVLEPSFLDLNGILVTWLTLAAGHCVLPVFARGRRRVGHLRHGEQFHVRPHRGRASH